MAYPLSTSIHLALDKSFRIPVNEQIKRIISCGFKYLDFNFLDWYSNYQSPFIHDRWEKWIDGAGETAAIFGAIFNQAHAPCPCFNCAHDEDLLKEYCRRAIKGCSMLGIPWMVFHAINEPSQFYSNEPWLSFNQRFFKELLVDCHQYGIGIAIENVWPVLALNNSPMASTEKLIELVDSFQDDLVGICWDTGHGNLTANSHNFKSLNHPEFLPAGNQYNEITKLGKRLKCLHINDNNGMDDDHIAPFFGTINWTDVISALDTIGYEHSFTFEAHNATHRMIDSGSFPDSIIDDSIRLLHHIGTTLIGMSRRL